MTAKTCCGGFSLRTGCFIIGVLGVVLGSILTTSIPCPAAAVVIVPNVLLILGIAMKIRLFLLPSMILGSIVCILLTALGLTLLAIFLFFLFQYTGDTPHPRFLVFFDALDETATDVNSIHWLAGSTLFINATVRMLHAIMEIICNYFDELSECVEADFAMCERMQSSRSVRSAQKSHRMQTKAEKKN